MKRSLIVASLLALAGMHAANAAVTISGTVTDTAGKALDSIRVSLQVPGSASFARDTTGTDGIFSISSDSTTGKLVLKSMSLGSTSYTTRYDTLVLSGKDTVGIAIKLTPVAVPAKSSVSGKVDSAGTGKAVSGAIVTLRLSGAGATSVLDTTAADGTYSFANVTTGIYTVSVAATGYTTKSVTDTVTATPDTLNVSLVAPFKSSVSGKVDSAGTGKAVVGAIVTLRLSGAGATSVLDTTAADGTYSFANVAGGIYTVSFVATGYTTKTVTDTVTATPDTLNVSLATPVPPLTITISGTVSDSTGAKMDSVYVALRSVGTGASTLLRDTTGTDGTFSLNSSYVSGTYVLRLIKLKGTADTLLDTISLDSANYSVAIVWKKSITTGIGSSVAKIVQSASFSNGVIQLGDMTSAGTVRLFDAKGELVVVRPFQPGANVSMAIGRKLTPGSYILSVVQKSGMLQKRIVVQ